MNQEELMHSGVKGMRWGVRKARPSSGNGGGKKSSTAQKKAARAKVQTKARRMRKVRLSDIDKMRNDAAKRAMQKAENSIFGTGMAKVPGKLEYYHSYRVGKVVDGRGKATKVHAVTHVTKNQVAARVALGLAVFGAMSMVARV